MIDHEKRQVSKASRLVLELLVSSQLFIKTIELTSPSLRYLFFSFV